MLIGLYGFYITLEKLVVENERDHLVSLMSDVIYEIREDSELFTSDMDVDDYIGNLTQANTRLRIQVINLDGVVIGDTDLSDHALARVENHGNRPEFKQALQQGTGSDVRFSTVTSVDRIYYSMKESVNGQDFVVIISLPMHQLKQMNFQLMGILIGMVLLSLSFLIGTSYVSNRQIVHKVEEEQKKQDERIRQRTHEIELMHRLANMLAACNNMVEAQQIVSDILPRILGNVNGSVSLMRASRNQLITQLDWGDIWPGSASFAPEECWSLRKGRAHLSNNDFHSLSCGHMHDMDNNQTLCIPLTAHGNTIGIMHLYFGQGDIKIDPITEQLAFSVSEHLGLALANLSLQEKLRSQALSDPLTGLFNRRFFDQKLEEHSMNSATSEQPLSLLMLDLDHFKRFNDNFGHDAGDFVLKEISALLKQSVSEDEIACRLGGEELAILLPHYSMEQATEFGQTLCDAVRSMHLEHKGLSLGQLGVSIGVAMYPKPASDTESLVKMADKALYMAKDMGRSRVVNYDEYSRHKAPALEVVDGEEVSTSLPKQ
ncbi:MAG: sensor domain-containing diguanylate cyclase [Vibrio toranzoniae]|uniref:sensor domain-containing diguanylate cyclase n=1 Tax=Vibrio toranzoniae TaxID=1194427 RepID=UPI001376D1BE|nr:sensor domain-containing diguanylate cyclase [Vibrio toranzoniae]NAZ70142.1 diguanylate cyclase [Vibrio toranzoniae]NAZ93650.1 diguanylate cyclase [Vibrio toranzoniae]NAZ98179.1 diguanylate cyclase [Vibrio toranzoniae]